MNRPYPLIRATIRNEEMKLRQAHPWLRHQNLIGASLLLLSVSFFLLCSISYFRGIIPGWLCILLNAFFLSIGHEVEHDLIHQLYFSHQNFIRHFLLGLGWLTRITTINPWVRIRIHNYHHQHSGDPTDAEERLIGNGMEYRGIKRWLVMLGPWFAPIQARGLLKSGCPFGVGLMVFSLFPMVVLTTGFIIYWGLLQVPSLENMLWGAGQLPLWNAIFIAWVIPNLLRMFCLQFVSSSIHFFGDVSGVCQQTQVFKAWYWLPLQIFCFNFGATHALHHIYPNQPFYIRQWLASRVYPVMLANGIRFNDIGTFRRNNRYGPQPAY